jgi:hypothetical protein
MRPDEDVLKELRERRTTATRAWKDRREEGQKDIQCLAGEVWDAMDPAGLKQRTDAHRPAIATDELGQYINQVGNDVRQNKRAINATPIDQGATEQTADFRQSLMRQIEYRSNAQRDVYSPIFEDALQRSYGFGRVKSQYVSETSRNQELLLEAFPNPDVVTVDPDGAMLAPDCSKIEYAFIVESWTRAKFKREFPDADIVDFTDEHVRIAPDWIKGENVQVAEYWTIERMRRRVVFLKSDPAHGVFEDILPTKPAAADVDDSRWVDVPYVCQYFTNGLELLAKKGAQKRTPWGGKSIPIFSCFGKILYVQTGSGTETRLLSMVRLARDPFMLYCYIRTCEAEVIGSVPRATWVGYEGQFRGHETDWQKANHEPVPYLEVRPTTEGTGAQVLPLPLRQSWDPPLQNLDLAAESARRAIQAAMGTSPLPTQAQRRNEKSGKALQQIEASGQKGSYHFVDHLDGMITRVGALLEENIPWCYDAARDVTVRKPDDQSAQQRINDPDDPDSVSATDGHHDITITVGPAYADEREASSDFADTIVGNQNLLQMVGPQKAAELTALAIRLKAVGPIGDEMADVIAPKPSEPGQPPTPQEVQQMQGTVQQLQQQLQEASAPGAIEQIKQQGAVQIKGMDLDFQRAKMERDSETKITVAELGAKVDRLQLFLEERGRLGLAEQQAHDRAHEAGMAAMQQNHAQAMTAVQQQHAVQMDGMKQAAADRTATRPTMKKTVSRDPAGLISHITEEQMPSPSTQEPTHGA